MGRCPALWQNDHCDETVPIFFPLCFAVCLHSFSCQERVDQGHRVAEGRRLHPLRTSKPADGRGVCRAIVTPAKCCMKSQLTESLRNHSEEQRAGKTPAAMEFGGDKKKLS